MVHAAGCGGREGGARARVSAGVTSRRVGRRRRKGAGTQYIGSKGCMAGASASSGEEERGNKKNKSQLPNLGRRGRTTGTRCRITRSRSSTSPACPASASESRPRATAKLESKERTERPFSVRSRTCPGYATNADLHLLRLRRFPEEDSTRASPLSQSRSNSPG